MALPVSAQENCTVYADIEDKLALGEHPIGTPMLSFMTRAELVACNDADQGAGICGGVGPSGVSFVANRGDPAQTAVVGKAWMSAREPFTGQLIAGAKFGDSIFDVGMKLRSLPAEFPEWAFRQKDDVMMLRTGDCLRAGNGAIWEYELIFDAAGRLVAAYASLKGYESPL
jgi:hypothetical protein